IALQQGADGEEDGGVVINDQDFGHRATPCQRGDPGPEPFGATPAQALARRPRYVETLSRSTSSIEVRKKSARLEDFSYKALESSVADFLSPGPVVACRGC